MRSECLLPLSERAVDLSPDVLGLLAGERVVLVVAGERLLVEARPVPADERPLHRLDDGAGVVLEGGERGRRQRERERE